MAVAGDLVVNLKLDNSQFIRSLKSAIGGASFGKLAGASFVGNLASSAVQGIASTIKGIGQAMISAAASSVRLAADFESVSVSLEVLLGSASAAKQKLAELKQFALATPFEFGDTVTAFRTLKARGIASDQIIPMLRILGDTAAAVGGGQESINNMVLAISQISAKGKLQAEELTRQLGQYIPGLKFLAQHLGITQQEVIALMEAGQIDAGTALNALFQGMVREFGGTMAKQLLKLAGQWKNFKEQIVFVARDIGIAIIRGFNLLGLMRDAQSLLRHFQAVWLPGIKSLIADFGKAWQIAWKGIKAAFSSGLGHGIQIGFQLVVNWRLVIGIMHEEFKILAMNVARLFLAMAKGIVNSIQIMAHNVMLMAKIAANPGQAGKLIASMSNPLGGFKLPNPIQTTQERNKLMRKLLKSISDALFAKPVQGPPEKALAPFPTTTTDSKGKFTTTPPAALAGSREALSSIAKNVNGANSPLVKAVTKTNAINSQILKATQQVHAAVLATGSPIGMALIGP